MDFRRPNKEVAGPDGRETENDQFFALRKHRHCFLFGEDRLQLLFVIGCRHEPINIKVYTFCLVYKLFFIYHNGLN